MESKTIFTEEKSWFTAEGAVDAKPVIYRGRQIPEKYIGDPSLPNVLLVRMPFEVTDSKGLPSQSQYEVIDEFERKSIEPIEASRIGIVAFIKTFNGIVQYFLYVSDGQLASASLNNTNAIDVELATGDDDNWSEYRAFMRGMHNHLT